MINLIRLFENTINDSRIDFPQENLSTDVWEKSDSKYILKSNVRDVILDAVRLITKEDIFNIIKDVRIVGSICSNQYTSSSDIDVHFILKTLPKDITVDELNKRLKVFIKENDKLNNLFIETYKVEFYFQQNEYQDLMSAGVYIIEDDNWLIGPSEVELDFNPYEEFQDAFPIIGEYIKRIEDQVNVIKKLINDPGDLEILNDEIQSLLDIKKELKEYRASFSSPENEEEAAEYREAKEWHRIDAVFKFIDKFGYLKLITKIEKAVNDKDLINKDIIEELKEILK